MIERIGRYEILDRVASGGQGTVYRARDTVLYRIVAVKVINQPVADDPSWENGGDQESSEQGFGLTSPRSTCLS